MSPESWVALAILFLLIALFVAAMSQALGPRGRAGVAKAYRFFVKPAERKEATDEPTA